jgi:hypothetical protein
MKKLLVLFGAILLFLSVFFSGCTGPSQGFHIRKLNSEPATYFNVTDQQLDKYPHLKEAILSKKTVETPLDEFYEFKGVTEFHDTNYIQYQNDFFQIAFYLAD